MTLVSFLLISLIIATITITGISSTLSCYVCGGYGCLAVEEYEQECANNKTTHCFYMTANNTDMARGCYEKEDPYFKECEEHIMNTCDKCNSTLCNDQDPYNNDTLTCYKCYPPSADCRDPVFIANNVRPCRQFMYTDRPSCYSLYDHRVHEYEFGCLSEAPDYVRRTCDHDWFKLTCHICYHSRCNKELFIEETEGDLQCYTWDKTENEIISCPYHDLNAPYYGCYYENTPDKLIKGCISERFREPKYIDWVNLMTPELREDRLKVCSLTLCNSVEWENTTYCYKDPVRTCVSYYNKIGYCMAVQLPEHGENDYTALCEDRFPCWKTDMCIYKCVGAHLQSDGTKISCLEAKWEKKFYCYSCSDCPVLVNDKLSLLAACSNKECAEVVIDGVLHRGCSTEKWAELCAAESAICRFCDSQYCNTDPYGIHCITCSFDNNLCNYDPLETFNDLCNIPIEVNMTYGCYSKLRVDGLVERGCYYPEPFECDEMFECETCNDNFCNIHRFMTSSCLTCSGDLDSKCARNITYLEMDSTVVEDCALLYEVPLCYTIIRETSVSRGCTSNEYLPIFNKDCRSGEDCFFCDVSNCNYMTRTMGGVRSSLNAMSSDSVRWSSLSIKCMGFLFIFWRII